MAEHDLQSVAFPKLDEAQMAALGRCPLTTLRRYRDGEKLFEVGDRDFKFFVVKSGKVEIVDESGETPRTIAVHGPGEFTGDVAQLTGGPAIVNAIARGDCEVYEVSPDALRQLLNHHPDLGDIILQAFIARRQLLRESGEFAGLRVIGSRYSQDTFRVRDFLAKNRVPFTWLDLEADPRGEASCSKRFGVSEADTPVVAWGHKLLLRNPSNRELAEALGLRRPLEQTVYDLVVVGAGPAGLAAAVYGASEGLSTVVLERTGPGGQAGRSMRIENYLGFPTGITGSELAERAAVQANKFGARPARPHAGHGTDVRSGILRAAARRRRDGRRQVPADRHRGRLSPAGRRGLRAVRGLRRLLRRDPHRGADVPGIGGGGRRRRQLRRPGRRLPRRPGPQGVPRDPRRRSLQEHVELPGPADRGHAQHRGAPQHRGPADVTATAASPRSSSSTTRRGRRGRSRRPRCSASSGRCRGPTGCPRRSRGTTRASSGPGPSVAQSPHWTARRQPFLLETSRPGVFAAGDVRSGSIKRVASAVGEGAMAVQFVHEYLKAM